MATTHTKRWGRSTSQTKRTLMEQQQQTQLVHG